MNLLSSQSYSELAEDTNIENLPDERRSQLKRDLLLYQINQMDSNSKYIKKPTFLHLILNCCNYYFTSYNFLVPLAQIIRSDPKFNR